jgi:hypothetical protein
MTDVSPWPSAGETRVNRGDGDEGDADRRVRKSRPDPLCPGCLASCQPESLWRNLEADLMRLPSRLMPDPTSRPQAEETGSLREPDFLGIGFGQA